MTAQRVKEGKALCPPSLHRLDHLQATLPEELLSLDTWLPWLALPRGNGKIGKVPSLPRSGILRPIDSRGAGLTLPEAHGLARQHGAGGVGVVLVPELGLTALDLDLPLGDRAQTLLSTVPGYAESSPGGGVHLWLAGSVPCNHRQAGIEVLGQGFVTVTGAALSGRGRALGTLPEVLEQVGVASGKLRPLAKELDKSGVGLKSIHPVAERVRPTTHPPVTRQRSVRTLEVPIE